MLLKSVYHWLLPRVCILCKNLSQQSLDICKPCAAELPTLKHCCQTCGLPGWETIRCGQCLQMNPPFDITHTLFSYEAPIPKLILDLKFQQALTHARLMGEMLAAKIQNEWYQKTELPGAIIPMPLHKERLRERGFNQAIEIAKPIAKQLNLPLLTHAAVRVKSTAAQATLSGDERRKNIRHAFIIKKEFKNIHIAVVDDVITTGSTIHEFCRMLKKHGAHKISVWCCARRSLSSSRHPEPAHRYKQPSNQSA